MPTVRISGPFFRLGFSAAAKAVTDSIRELVNEGEKAVDVQLYPGHGFRTGHYKRSVHGELRDSYHGDIKSHGGIDDTGVVYGPWLEGVSSRNARSRFKGYRMFRNAYQRLERIKDAVVRKHIGRAAERLN